jgi:hypothetical protein
MMSTQTTKQRPGAVMLRVMGTTVMTLGLLFSILVGAQPAHSQTAGQIICTPHGEVVDLLGKRYDEERVAIGVASNGGLIEIFTTQNGSTWTIVVTTPGGLSCPVTTGQDWFAIVPPPDGPEA